MENEINSVNEVGNNVPPVVNEPAVANNPVVTKKKSPVLTICLVILAVLGVGFGVYAWFFRPAEQVSSTCPKCEKCEECPKCAESEKECPSCEKCEETDKKTLAKELIRKMTPPKPMGNLRYVGGFSYLVDMQNDESLKMKLAAYNNYQNEYEYYKFNGIFYDMFGYDAPEQSFGEECLEYEYSANPIRKYTQKVAGCGGVDPGIENYFVSEVKQIGDELSIEVIFVRSDLDEASSKQIVTFTDNSTESFDCEGDLCLNALNQEFAEKNSDKLPHYVINFTVRDDGIFFKSASRK